MAIFNERAYLSKSTVMHSIYFSSIVKSRSNPCMESTNTKL